jgi:hypothetical protein
MDHKLHILQHSLGLDQYGEGRQYRNHFCTGLGSKDWDSCMALVYDGLMKEHHPSELTGGDTLFTVTPKGIDFVALNSPQPPKLTRSQKRYRLWLKSDSGLSFGEWLRGWGKIWS